VCVEYWAVEGIGVLYDGARSIDQFVLHSQLNEHCKVDYDDDSVQWTGSGTGCSFNEYVQLPIVIFPFDCLFCFIQSVWLHSSVYR